MRFIFTLLLAISLYHVVFGQSLFETVKNFFIREKRQPQFSQPQKHIRFPQQFAHQHAQSNSNFHNHQNHNSQNLFQRIPQQFQTPVHQGEFRFQNKKKQPQLITLDYKTCAREESIANCPKTPPNHVFQGKKYLLTWNIDCSFSNCLCKNFTGYEAEEYCASMGGHALSMDTKEKTDHFLSVSAQYGQRYYWTGGRIPYPEKKVVWPNGAESYWTRTGEGYWSHKGGLLDKDGNPVGQPDNRNYVRDGCEPEFCLGILNNYYADGIKWHDVACHHKKPTICEF